jgi:serine/threonine protein kinase
MVASWRIEAVLGAGGTGVVYRATDTKLDRPVAIKFLGENLADPDARRRFQQEARTASSLNHPHIVTVHDVGEHEGLQYIVSELMDGGTLQDWAREPRSWRKIVEVLTGVADALATAHAAGIVHRDVKPANILMSRGGYAKLADFGLAKLRVATHLDPAGHTMTGTVIGTIAYMSPEQAAGKPLDERTDVFSFGVVLYELISGKPPFSAGTDLELLRQVIEGTVPALHTDAPEALRLIIDKAIAKEPDERYQSMREVVVDLKRVQRQHTSSVPAAHRETVAANGWRSAWLAVPLVLIGAAAGAAVLSFWSPQPNALPAAAPQTRFEVATPELTDAVTLALSPDGQSIVFEGVADNRSQLWLHSLSSLTSRPLPGTEAASFPFWSPSNRSIGFFADGKLKRMDLDTDLVRVLADASIGRGGAWGSDGRIVFAPGTNDPLISVSELGGETRRLTELAATQAGHRFPQFLPDGEHLFYYVTGSPESRGVVLAARDGNAQRLFDADTAAVFGAEHLFFSRQGALYAQRFDAVRRELVGAAVTLPDQVEDDSTVYTLALSASSTGSIAYRTASSVGGRQFTWFDRTGSVVGRTGDASEALSPSMSPDGRTLAFSRAVNGNQDIWLMDIASGNITRFTFDPGIDFVPLWSPDGSRILFSSNRSGVFDLYEKPASGAGTEELVLDSDQNKFAVDWAASGDHVLYVSNDAELSYDIWALPRWDRGERAEPFTVVRTRAEERDAQFSPDGNWIAYQSNESGRLEIYAQPFRGTARRQISREGGAQVRWRSDAAELYYLSLDGTLMSVPLRFDADGAAVEAGAPEALFGTRMGRGVQTSNRQQYVSSPDGTRFLMSSTVDDASRSAITVVLNWQDDR